MSMRKQTTEAVVNLGISLSVLVLTVLGAVLQNPATLLICLAALLVCHARARMERP